MREVPAGARSQRYRIRTGDGDAPGGCVGDDERRRVVCVRHRSGRRGDAELEQLRVQASPRQERGDGWGARAR